MKRKIIALLILSLWVLYGYHNPAYSTECRKFEAIDDPLVLKYRFITVERNRSVSPQYRIPMKINADDRLGMVAIGNNWNQPDTMSCVIFYPGILGSNAIRHINIGTIGINSFHVFDFDNDSLDEIAIIYPIRDSVWMEIIDSEEDSLFKKFMATGKDRDGNGYWDGGGYICGAADINDDHFPEIFLGIDTGYDLYPRKLLCIDWHNNAILWEYKLAPVMNHRNFHVKPFTVGGEPHIIIGLGSKGNSAIGNDMDDLHSYLMVLDKRGKLKWRKELGEAFTSCHPIMFDYNDDGFEDILVNPTYHQVSENKDSAEIDCGRLDAYDRNGELLKTIDLGPGRVIGKISTLDVESDGREEIVVSTKSSELIIYDQHLIELKRCSLYTQGDILDSYDYLGLGNNQFLIGTFDRQLWLTDTDFRPLAAVDSKADINFDDYHLAGYRSALAGDKIIMGNRFGTELYVLGFEKSPWYTIFSRNPILAFLAAFIPLSIIIFIIWFILTKFRQKNRIILEQRDKLNSTLSELKETQQKLIAFEKYRQAKDIAGGVAHEIHNALFPAISSLDKLKSICAAVEVENQDRIRKLLNLTDKAVVRAGRMTELVNTYTRLESEKMDEVIPITVLMQEIVNDNKTKIDQFGVSVSLDIDDKASITCFKPHAYSLFNNLMINALDALAQADIRSIEIKAYNKDDGAMITFADSGCGIPRESIDRVFDMFYSTKPKSGTGLGLAMVKKIVELYEGQIEVESFLDKGTKFTILLL